MSDSEKIVEEVRKNIEGLFDNHNVPALSRIWSREFTRSRIAACIASGPSCRVG